MLSEVRFDWESIVKSIDVVTTDSKKLRVKGKDANWTLIPQYPACQSVALTDYFDLKQNVPAYVEITMNKIPNLSIQVKIGDREKSLTRRTLESSNFDYDGIPLEIGNLTSGLFFGFSLALFETIHLETDQNCKNYPTEEFANYRECDMDFVYKEMKNNYKIMPFWAAKTLDEVTNKT